MKKLIPALAGLAMWTPAALAASHYLKVSPDKAAAGKTVTVSGSVGHGCRAGHKGDAATIYSRAFKGATKHTFAGVPSVSVSLSRAGAFSFKLGLSKQIKKGKYSVSGRCGGGKFGSAALTVTRPASSGPPVGFY